MGEGGCPGVAQDARDGGRRWREAFVRCVRRWCGDADDGSGKILLPTVQLQVTRLGIETGATEDRDKHTNKDADIRHWDTEKYS